MCSKDKFTLFFIVLFMGVSSVCPVFGEDIIALKREILSHEINIQNVVIKEMGGSDDVMLEGKVTSQVVSDQIQKRAKDYFPNTFSLLNVVEVKVFAEISVLAFENLPKGLNTNNNLMKAMHNGFETESQFELIIFDATTRQNFMNEVTSKLNATALNFKINQDSSSGNRIQYHNETSHISLEANYLDQGFFEVKLSFEDAKQQVQYQKTAFCPRGQNLLMAFRNKGDALYYLLFINVELESII